MRTRPAILLPLTLGATLAVTALIEVPGKLMSATDRPVHYLLIATVFNALRIPALGLVIGLLRLPPAGREHQGAS